MTKFNWTIASVLVILFGIASLGDDCNEGNKAKSSSGVGQVSVKVKKNEKGFTTEQQNVADRLEMDNKPGSIKHLYVISAMSGQVLIYSTVRGKVTSSGKKLAPKTVVEDERHNGMWVEFDGKTYVTEEVIEDDGTFGNSIEYLYWWDEKGVYHQHYVSGGQILHVSDQPLPIKHVTINMELKGEAPSSEVIPVEITNDKKGKKE